MPKIKTTTKKLLADVYTPVGIYLRLRDRFRDTLLLESTDHHSGANSWSFICVNAIAGIEISSGNRMESKLPGQPSIVTEIKGNDELPDLLWNFMQKFQVEKATEKEGAFAAGLFGYTTYDSISFFEKLSLAGKQDPVIPLMRYRLYQYVIAINHFRDELFICENHVAGLNSELSSVESLIRNKDVPVYPFKRKGEESSNMTDDAYREMVQQGIKSCLRGDVFQIVLSRRFQQGYSGDEFNIYRALRSVNPSPYLFYFDYGDYRIMGSSPEAQLAIRSGSAIMHPIAGTVKRSGDDEKDKEQSELLAKDPKENAEHVMLVDLARNDLSRACSNVEVVKYKELQYFSHVIHMVSEVKGHLPERFNPFRVLAQTFPAGTLSGAPKIKAMQLIEAYEPTHRSYYGGTIGFVGFNGSFNHAIMIRSLLCKSNTLTYQAGAGVVAASVPENELQEVNNKLGALKKAIELAEEIGR